jgi:ribosomal protein S18 acetylase RimI-like enzyme
MLPEWFGIESAILDYEREIALQPTFLAEYDGQVLGFLCLKPHNPFSAEILVMAVQPQAHRRGIGRALVAAAETYACAQGFEYLQVKTLGPSHPDQGYIKTRQFYQALGYRPLDEFTKIWDENNPCLVMVKML